MSKCHTHRMTWLFWVSVNEVGIKNTQLKNAHAEISLSADLPTVNYYCCFFAVSALFLIPHSSVHFYFFHNWHHATTGIYPGATGTDYPYTPNEGLEEKKAAKKLDPERQIPTCAEHTTSVLFLCRQTHPPKKVMNIIQNGESSKSPHTQGINGDLTKADGDVEMMDGENGAGVELGRPEVKDGDERIEKERKRGTARLILPHWDGKCIRFLCVFLSHKLSGFNDFCMTLVAPVKPIHSSQDLISLLHLDTLYNTYVRPFADLPGDESQPGADGNDTLQRAKKKAANMPGRKKMEKGYQHLIEDCIGEWYHTTNHLDKCTLGKKIGEMYLWSTGRPNTTWIQEWQPFIVTIIKRCTLPVCTSAFLITRANRSSSKGSVCDCKVRARDRTGWGKYCFFSSLAFLNIWSIGCSTPAVKKPVLEKRKKSEG